MGDKPALHKETDWFWGLHMRPLEALLAGVLTLSAISLFIPSARRYRWVHLLPSSAILLSGLQLLLEGYRWQMVPLYCIAVVLVLMTLFPELVLWVPRLLMD